MCSAGVIFRIEEVMQKKVIICTTIIDGAGITITGGKLTVQTDVTLRNLTLPAVRLNNTASLVTEM